MKDDKLKPKTIFSIFAFLYICRYRTVCHSSECRCAIVIICKSGFCCYYARQFSSRSDLNVFIYQFANQTVRTHVCDEIINNFRVLPVYWAIHRAISRQKIESELVAQAETTWPNDWTQTISVFIFKSHKHYLIAKYPSRQSSGTCHQPNSLFENAIVVDVCKNLWIIFGLASKFGRVLSK